MGKGVCERAFFQLNNDRPLQIAGACYVDGMVWEWIKRKFGGHGLRGQDVGGEPAGVSGAELLADRKDRPESFGYKIAWLCLKTDDPAAVREELHLSEARFATWREGLGQAYRDVRVCFVTPVVDGWTLVVGFTMTPEVNEPGMLELMKRLSSRFGEAYYFGSHRVSSYYAWVAAHSGEVTRAFCRGDGILMANFGAPTQKELSLGYPDQAADDFEVVLWADEEHVLALAAAWSFDPKSLEGRDEPEGPGWLCQVKRE
jgi:hypothetical protein